MPDVGSGFPRESRLLKSAEYGRVFSRPMRATDNYFTILCRPSGRTSPRLGLAVSKKNSRLAVDRNRIKRVIRESFRKNKATLGGMDFVVMIRSGVHKVSNRQLFASLDRHWVQLRTKLSGLDS